MTLESLQFATPDNACASLRILAELIRRGEASVKYTKVLDGSDNETLAIEIVKGKR